MSAWRSGAAGPHGGQPVALAGVPFAAARGALLLLHGRGGSALDMLELGAALAPPGWAIVAPQAATGSWYPQRFLAPLADNEPALSSALAVVDETVARLRAALPGAPLAVGGFSQGACLALEWAARAGRPLAALLAFTGGLIGPEIEPARYRGDLAATPVLLASAEEDPHVPATRVRATAGLLERLGAAVELLFAPGPGHAVRPAEVVAARRLLGRPSGGPEAPRPA